MVEEWQLAANKETKRIMMRDAMREIASKVVDAANCCDGDVSEGEKGAARVFVAGERGVGKVCCVLCMTCNNFYVCVCVVVVGVGYRQNHVDFRKVSHPPVTLFWLVWLSGIYY